jgi:hypothetical protein
MKGKQENLETQNELMSSVHSKNAVVFTVNTFLLQSD